LSIFGYFFNSEWLLKNIKTLLQCNDPEGVKQVISNFVIFYRNAQAGDQARLKSMWEEAGLGDFPEEKENEEK